MAVRLLGKLRASTLYSATVLMYLLRATVMRFSVPSSVTRRSWNAALALSCGYCSATTIRRLSAPVNSPCAFWNFSNASGLFTSSGVAWMLVARERASITLVSVSCSKLASPLTVATMLGIRSERRWYWFSTSAHAPLTCSSSVWKLL